MDRLLDGPPRLREPLVVGRPGLALGGRFAELVEDDLVEIVDDRPAGDPTRSLVRDRRSQRLGDEIHRVPDVARRRPRDGYAHPGLALATTCGPARSMAPALRSTDLPGELGLQRRVGATGAAAQPLVVELDDIGNRCQHRAHRQMGTLHVTQVARILHGDRPEPSTDRQPVDQWAQRTRWRRAHAR